jgi:hypothetical protein
LVSLLGASWREPLLQQGGKRVLRSIAALLA